MVASGVMVGWAAALGVVVGVTPLEEAICREGELPTAMVLVRDVPAATVVGDCCLLLVRAKIPAPAKMRMATLKAIREIVRVFRGIWPMTPPPTQSTATRR